MKDNIIFCLKEDAHLSLSEAKELLSGILMMNPREVSLEARHEEQNTEEPIIDHSFDLPLPIEDKEMCNHLLSLYDDLNSYTFRVDHQYVYMICFLPDTKFIMVKKENGEITQEEEAKFTSFILPLLHDQEYHIKNL